MSGLDEDAVHILQELSYAFRDLGVALYPRFDRPSYDSWLLAQELCGQARILARAIEMRLDGDWKPRFTCLYFPKLL